jgi:hypothetical protein
MPPRGASAFADMHSPLLLFTSTGDIIFYSGALKGMATMPGLRAYGEGATTSLQLD